MVRWKSTKLWALASVLVLVFVACGGDDGDEEAAPEASETTSASPSTVGAQEYVSTLCTEMQNWLTKLQEGQTQVQQTVQPGADPAEGQAALATFFDSAVTATEELITAIEDAGVPDVEGGEAISQDILTKFQDAKEALESARAQVDTLPTDDPQAFGRAAQELGTAVQSQLESIGDALSTLSQPELDEAAAQEPACTSLSPTGG